VPRECDVDLNRPLPPLDEVSSETSSTTSSSGDAQEAEDNDEEDISDSENVPGYSTGVVTTKENPSVSPDTLPAADEAKGSEVADATKPPERAGEDQASCTLHVTQVRFVLVSLFSSISDILDFSGSGHHCLFCT
jgi:hypothetical protein